MIYTITWEGDQHEVLGALLVVGQQFRFQRRVRFGVGAARPGTGNGAVFDLAVVDPHQHLRRRAHDVRLSGIEDEHVGRRVDGAQGAIHAERAGRGLTAQAAR